MKKVIWLGVIFAITLFLALATSVAAQKGFVASASLASTGVSFDDDDIRNENGFGLQLDLGYNFNPRIGVSGGGGIHWFVGRNVGLNLGIIMTRINYDTVESEGVSVDGLDFKAWNSRIKAGVAVYF